MLNLVSFADHRMAPTLDRLRNHAATFEEIDKTFLFTERDLSTTFRERAGDRLRPNVRGFGYWVWKPEVVLTALSRVEDGGIVCYCDAGFHLNSNGKYRLQQYIAPLETDNADLVAFCHDKRLPNFALESNDLPDFSEHKYTKGDMFEYWAARAKPNISHTPQYASGLFLVKKTFRIIELLEEWREAALTRPELFDDSPSTSPNFDDFIENRHDQSYFSLMCKHVDHCAFSAFEFWYPRGHKLIPDWQIISDYPFHAKRDKKFGGARRFWQPALTSYQRIRKSLAS